MSTTTLATFEKVNEPKAEPPLVPVIALSPAAGLDIARVSELPGAIQVNFAR